MNKQIVFGISGIVVGILLTVLLVQVFSPRTTMMGYKNPISRQSVTLSQIDQHFIDQMIPHHQGAIDMANLALKKSSRPEIIELSNNIIKAQDKEIFDMKSWYKDWFNEEVSTLTSNGGMMSQGGMHMGSNNDIEILSSAKEFDKEFIEEMIPHHQMAIMMAQMLKSGTNRPEMLTLANNIIDSQTQEIIQMQEWYSTWYE